MNMATPCQNLRATGASSSVIEPCGADTMRLAILFVAPPEKDFDWDEKAVAGANRLLSAPGVLSGSLQTANASATLDPTTLMRRQRH